MLKEITEETLSRFQELGLDPRIVKGLECIGFIELFPIQEQAISPLLEGKDVIGQAKTGTGKTAAYAIPMLQRIDAGKRSVQGLILTPTRELAVQVAGEIRRMGKYTDIQAVAIYGGQPIDIQLSYLKKGVQIVAGTPGRIIDLIIRKALSLSEVKFVVLDEADTMLDMGFIDDIEYIIKEIPEPRQLSLFSATMPEKIIRLSEKYLKDPEIILIDSDEPSVETLDQKYVLLDGRLKLNVLTRILSDAKHSNFIIFCATKIRADMLARDIGEKFLGVEAIHSNLSQSQRDRVMHMFKAGKTKILVATDIAARGLDIPHVDCIVNYDVPKNPLIYFHRVGRTARAGGLGKSFTLVSHDELDDFIRIQDLTATNIKPAYFGERKASSKDLLNLENIHKGGSKSIKLNNQLSKYCERCGKWVNWISEGILCKCEICGKILN